MNTQGIIAQLARIREQANLIIDQELKARNVTGIVPAHGSVLSFLFTQTAPVPVKTVVKESGRVKSTITVMLGNLERNGYLRKKPSPQDGRVILVELTDKGQNLRPVFREISTILLDAVYGSMDQKDRETLVALLERLDHNLRAFLSI
ncbi:MAG: MarR family transcriptional regulator [Desulfoplanes sp.]|nr:MarR family transcriptional regulator [Desulfoplanes sp.]